jgi:hypothetical protein
MRRETALKKNTLAGRSVVRLLLRDSTLRSDPARRAYSGLRALRATYGAQAVVVRFSAAVVRFSAAVAPPLLPQMPSPTIQLDVASPVTADIDIANSVEPLPIANIAAELVLRPEHYDLYGKYKAKICF